MKMFCETLTFCETSRKILDIYVSAALYLRSFVEQSNSTSQGLSQNIGLPTVKYDSLANFFHLAYGTYGTLSNSKSVELGGIKLRRDFAIYRKCRCNHWIQRKI